MKTDIRKALDDARLSILQSTDSCTHDVSCADPACVAAGHDHEGGEDDWGCGHDCACVPACKGYEPGTCEDATKVRDLVAHIDSVSAHFVRGPAPVDPGETTREGEP